MDIKQLLPLAAFGVVSLIVAWKFGIILALLFFFVALYAFIFLGLGKKSDGVFSYEARAAKPGQTAPRRLTGIKELKSSPYPGEVSTLYDNFQRGVRINGEGACLGTRPAPDKDYVWETYNQVNTRIENFGSGLFAIGADVGDRVGFYAKNRAEWVIGAQACNAYSLVSVAIYDTLGEENRQYVVDQAEIKVILTTNGLLNNIFALNADCPNLKAVVVMGTATKEERENAKKAGIEIYDFTEVEKIGKEKHRDVIPPKPDQLAILMYTSGTTSRPKGVMMTHGNVVASVAGVTDSIPRVTKEDSYLSYLPLAHVLERAAEALMYCNGARVGFYQGDIRKLDSDIKQVKPTIYAGVPKVYQRVMNTIKKKVDQSPIHIKILFNVAFALKSKFIDMGWPTGLLDALVFNKVKDGLGGRCKLIVSGGAPLGAECHQFLRVCFGCPAQQGYGLTETGGGASVTPMEMISPWEKAGAPISCCEIKLVDAGKYSTSHNPPQGEVCVKGANITLGYYKMPEKTASDFVIEEDGERWFHTGDVGQWNADGTLSIVGRVKDIFKLDGGEYIAPERLETIYSQSKYVSNIFVYGDSNKSNVVAIVVPEAGAAADWAKANGVSIPDPQPQGSMDCPKSLCQNKQFNQVIKDDLIATAKSAKLNRYEQLPAIHLDSTFWTAATGLVTAALKNKRPALYNHYKDEVQALYSSLGQ